jgi:asparagine synthase (glutamine-hydrolysing)
VGIGVALSGGLDSSVLTALVRDIEPEAEIETFSFVSPGQASDESFWSNRVAAQLRTHQHIVSPSATQVARDIDDVVRSQGEPFGSLSIYAQYAVYREARMANLPVMMDGQGGDEVFAGYSGYPEFVIRSMISQGNVAEALTFVRQWSTFPHHSVGHALLRLTGTYLPSSLGSIGAIALGRAPRPPWIKVPVLAEYGVQSRLPAIYGYPIQKPAGDRELAKRLSEALFSGEMVNLLRHGDRNSMRWSIESRVPFLNDDVVALAQSLPESFLVSPRGRTKNILRHAMRGLLTDDVLFRKDKVGFEAPDLKWLRKMSTHSDFLLEGIELIPWIDPVRAREYLSSVWGGKRPYSHAVWRLINLAKWKKSNP